MLIDDDGFLRLVDVGALGGLGSEFAAHADSIWPVLFEPNPDETFRLKELTSIYPKSSVVERALGHVDGQAMLHIARNPTCSSLLKQNDLVLDGYGISHHFKEIGSELIQVCRYETLHRQGLVPTPDAIKIDVQGFEYQVLLGFGDLLTKTIAIKLEAHFYPIYREQKLIASIVEFLSQFGLILRKIEQNKLENFAGDLVEVDAFFTQARRTIRDYSDINRRKYDLISNVWSLPSYNFDLP